MEERIAKAEKDIETIKADIKVLDKRIEKHGYEIDGLGESYKDLKLDLELIKQSSKYTEKNTEEIKETLKDLQVKRDEDHYIKPLERSSKLLWAVLGILIAFIVNIVLQGLFPGA